MTVTLNGIEYPLAANLRVAYKVQGEHNHKPYSKVFESIGDMTVEEQIAIMYCSFISANPTLSFEWTKQKFIDYYLDHMNLKDLLKQLEQLVRQIMGEDEGTETSNEPATTEVVEGN